MKTEQYTTLVVDDEAFVRKELIKALNDGPFFNVIGEASTVAEAENLTLKKSPQVIYLDIKIGQGDAYQLLDKLKVKLSFMPAIILNTGFNNIELAQQAFDEHKKYILTILKKPFWHNWDNKEEDIALKVNEYYKRSEEGISYLSTYFLITEDYKSFLIQFDELIMISVPEDQKGKGKIQFTTTDDTFTIGGSLKKVANELPAKFKQISRYIVINTDFFRSIDHSDQTISLKGVRSKPLGLGETYKEALFKYLGI
jgi:DNA-binding LytR/AlgR family response regulator